MSGSSSPNRILILRFSALGDVIQTLPMLTWLRRAYPQAKIGWAIDEELAPAIEGHPALDYIHPIPRKRWSKSLKNPTSWFRIKREFDEYIEQIKAIDYEVAVDTQSLFKTALTAYCAGIKRRVGYNHNREFSAFMLNEKYLSMSEYFDPAVFHMEHIARLAREVGCADTTFDIEAPAIAEDVAGKVAVLIKDGFASTNASAPIVAVAPGTQWQSKLWPEQYWTDLITRILQQTELNVLFVGSKGDAPLCARIKETLPLLNFSGRVHDISGKTNIREMYAVYKHVSAAIGMDSAPQHVAGAMKTPVTIAMFGPTAHRRTPPFGSPVNVVLSTELGCQPCHKKTCPLGTDECLTGIRPQMVFDKLIKGLSDQRIEAMPATALR